MATTSRTFDTGQTLYTLIRDSGVQIWNGTGLAFEAYTANNYVSGYATLTGTEQGSCGYYFVVTPSFDNGWYQFDWRMVTGAIPDEGDPSISLESSYWDGTRWFGRILAVDVTAEIVAEKLQTMIEVTP